MIVKIKKLSDNAVVPSYSRIGDAGLDLTVTSHRVEGELHVYGTGLAIEIPPGSVGLIFPRSSITKTSMDFPTGVSVIDSNYRGEVLLKFRSSGGGQVYEVGDRVAQLIVVRIPGVQMEVVDELSDSNRGQGGFGSSGQ